MKKIAIIIFIFVALATVLIIGGKCLAMNDSYANIARLCDLIYQGNTEEAIAKIQNMDNVNCYSAPLWSRKLFRMIERDIDLPLIAACEVGNYEIVKALLDKGADPNLYLKGGWSPIEIVFERGHANRVNIAKELIAHKADVDAYGSYDSALFIELKHLLYHKEPSEEERNLRAEAILLLLDHGATQSDQNGNSIMHYFVSSDEIDLLEQLPIEHQQLINQPNLKGQTPLMWAVIGNSVEGVQYLLRNGADVSVKSLEGKTAYDYAVEKGYTELAELVKP